MEIKRKLKANDVDSYIMLLWGISYEYTLFAQAGFACKAELLRMGVEELPKTFDTSKLSQNFPNLSSPWKLYQTSFCMFFILQRK